MKNLRNKRVEKVERSGAITLMMKLFAECSRMAALGTKAEEGGGTKGGGGGGGGWGSCSLCTRRQSQQVLTIKGSSTGVWACAVSICICMFGALHISALIVVAKGLQHVCQGISPQRDKHAKPSSYPFGHVGGALTSDIAGLSLRHQLGLGS